jgi:hypothetical protein
MNKPIEVDIMPWQTRNGIESTHLVIKGKNQNYTMFITRDEDTEDSRNQLREYYEAHSTGQRVSSE